MISEAAYSLNYLNNCSPEEFILTNKRQINWIYTSKKTYDRTFEKKHGLTWKRTLPKPQCKNERTSDSSLHHKREVFIT